MEISPYLKHFPLILRLGTGIDVTSGRVYGKALAYVILCWLVATVSNINHLLSEKESVGLPVKPVYEILLFLCSLAVVLLTLKHRQDIAILFDSLLKPFACDPESGAAAVRNHHRLVNRFGSMYIFYHVLFITIFVLSLSPLFTLPFYPHDTPVRQLPLPVGSVPFDTQSYVVYAIAYFVSASAIVSAGLCQSSSHLLMIFACLRIKTELHLLAEFVLSLKLKQSRDDFLHQHIVQVVKLHVQIIRFVSVFNHCFSTLLLILSQASIIAIASLAFQMLDRSGRQARDLWIGVFMMCACLCVPGIFNVTGQTITDQSARVHRALYACYRPGQSRRVTGSLRVMMTVATRPLCLSVGGLYPLSNESYANIVRATYSYINFLMTLRKPSGAD